LFATYKPEEKLFFFGGGFMAEAILKAVIKNWPKERGHLAVIEPAPERCRYLTETYKVEASPIENLSLKGARAVVLAVKPQVFAEAFTPGAVAGIPETALIASIIAGKRLADLRAVFSPRPIVRIMPNTPLSVGEGMTVLARDSTVREDDFTFIKNIFAACGEVLEAPESQMDAVTGLSGSGPGFLFVIIDALADAGVLAGLSRATALKLAAQTVCGSGRMVLATGEHPARLRDQVASPGGTTIAGIAALERAGLRGALIDAVLAAAEKSRSFSSDD
jgi:pyrroline-5-carboxylate reductase